MARQESASEGSENPGPAPWQSASTEQFGAVGLWAGFLGGLPIRDAVAMARRFEAVGIRTLWLQEWGGVDPFIRAALYLQSTERLCIGVGVANVHARDGEAMTSAAATLETAFPGRFILGMGVSHRALVEGRGHDFPPPVPFMRSYLRDMAAHAGGRSIPPVVLGALGPKMLELAGGGASGAHTYFSPLPHTASARKIMGPRAWLAPTQMVGLSEGTGQRTRVAAYLQMCLGMTNYTTNLRRFGFSDNDFAPATDRLIDSLVVPADRDQIGARLRAQHDAGADHVVIQVIPPPSAETVVRFVERTAEVF